jgi:hypothetical protein
MPVNFRSMEGMISRGAEAGVEALRPRTRRAQRGLDAGRGSATLLPSGKCHLGSGITCLSQIPEKFHARGWDAARLHATRGPAESRERGTRRG